MQAGGNLPGILDVRMHPKSPRVHRGAAPGRVHAGADGRERPDRGVVLGQHVQHFPLHEAAVLDAFREAAHKEGMKPLRINGAMKVAAGITTVEEILKTVPPPTGDRRSSPR